jgi:predicted  nucleic acid-binding Zn-ribbon protein
MSAAAMRQAQDADERALDEKIRDERAAIDSAKAEKSSIETELVELDRELAGLISEADRKTKQLAAIQEGRMVAANKQQVDAQLRSLAQRRAEVQAKIRRLREKLD